jgi:hypothetical protein
LIAICPRCRERKAYFAPVHGDCNGLGSIECLCGGDQCICHNHGAAQCDGCPECEPTVVFDDADSWPHELPPAPPNRAADAARPKSSARRR